MQREILPMAQSGGNTEFQEPILQAEIKKTNTINNVFSCV